MSHCSVSLVICQHPSSFYGLPYWWVDHSLLSSIIKLFYVLGTTQSLSGWKLGDFLVLSEDWSEMPGGSQLVERHRKILESTQMPALQQLQFGRQNRWTGMTETQVSPVSWGKWDTELWHIFKPSFPKVDTKFYRGDPKALGQIIVGNGSDDLGALLFRALRMYMALLQSLDTWHLTLFHLDDSKLFLSFSLHCILFSELTCRITESQVARAGLSGPCRMHLTPHGR